MDIKYELGPNHSVVMLKEATGEFACHVKDIEEQIEMDNVEYCPFCGSEIKHEFLQKRYFDV